jgi:hypothetical protein
MSTSANDGERPSPWGQRSFIAAALVIALLATLTVVIVATGGGKSNETTAAEVGAATLTAAAPSSSASTDSVCGLPDGEQTIPRTAPVGTKWELVGTMAAPTAPALHGPGRVASGLRSCFAHSPVGALYAAANVLATTTDPVLREPLVRQLAVAGDGRDAALALLAATTDEPETSAQIQLAGFTFLSYGPSAATVDLAVRTTKASGTAGFVHLATQFRWESGDWKIVVPPSGDLGTNVFPLPDLTGYTPWGGA